MIDFHAVIVRAPSRKVKIKNKPVPETSCIGRIPLMFYPIMPIPCVVCVIGRDEIPAR